MTRKASLGLGLLVMILVGLPLGRSLIHLCTERWWFESIGYQAVFWKALFWEGLIGGVAFLLFIAILGLHYWLCLRLTRDRTFRLFESTELEPYSDFIVRSVSQFLIGLIGLIAAISAASEWTSVLQFMSAQPVDQSDPIFSRDISFYLFGLPFWDDARQVLLMLSIWSLTLVASLYSLKGIFITRSARLNRAILTHLTIAVTPVLALVGWGFWLERYHLLNQNSGAVYGIGYTDANARIIGLNIMCMVTVVTLGILLSALQRFRQRLFLITIFVFGTSWMTFIGLYPWMVQQFIVRPNELAKEKPYLSYNIQGTQAAYQLDTIQSENFDANADLSKADLASNQGTLQNVRLWDYNPLLQTYRQLQEIRSYYQFNDIDIDRYVIQGQFQQVMLSARELALDQLPNQAQNWVNQQLKYTHGHGLAMSPVNRVTSDGLPEFFIQDIPPKSSTDLEVKQPSIYYGELTNSYIFTGTTTDEFDYPQGRQNVLVRYSGTGGVPMGSFWRKVFYAIDLRNFQILISNYISPDTRVHYNRNVLNRVKHVAPFLRYDHDPYLVVEEGKLYWVVDAYTVSDRYPYSEPSVASTPSGSIRTSRQINYIRNAVKVIVDAYTGDIQFCITDPNDPIIQTYQRIFPNLFVERNQIKPATIQTHFRYPEDLFKIQTVQYLKYHMSDPEVFFNGEDLWQIPSQDYESQTIPVEPYYVIMRLPNQKNNEFILIQPFAPNKKRNMIAWMAARSDGDNYGSLVEYNFPKQRLVLGPQQIEARINQNPEISQQFTLWGQSGSKVIRGNLIILPINNSLLYIEPIYLRAEKAQLPELKRMVVAYDKSVVMTPTFEEAIEQIFGPESNQNNPTQQTTIQENLSKDSSTDLAQTALEKHLEAEEAISQGNWARYGELQKKLRSILQKLSQSRR